MHFKPFHVPGNCFVPSVYVVFTICNTVSTTQYFSSKQESIKKETETTVLRGFREQVL